MSVRRKATARKTAPVKSECLCMGFGPELGHMFRSLGSDTAKGHFRIARVEALRGLRALIDHRIETLSKHQRRGSTIEVE